MRIASIKSSIFISQVCIQHNYIHLNITQSQRSYSNLIETRQLALLLSLLNKVVVNLNLLLILLNKILISLSRRSIITTKRPDSSIVNVRKTSANASGA